MLFPVDNSWGNPKLASNIILYQLAKRGRVWGAEVSPNKHPQVLLLTDMTWEREKTGTKQRGSKPLPTVEHQLYKSRKHESYYITIFSSKFSKLVK